MPFFSRCDHLPVALKDLFLAGLRSRLSRLGRLCFLAFFFGFLHSLCQEFSIFCNLLVFLSVLFSSTLHYHVCCRICGVTRHRLLGALVLGSSPSLFKVFLIAYWWTSPSLQRLKSFQILLALWGPNCQGAGVSASPGISFLFYQVENT